MRGTAVIVSESGGLREIVEGSGGGVMVPPGDAGALATALGEVLSNRELAERMFLSGTWRAFEQYHRTATVDDLRQLKLAQSRTIVVDRWIRHQLFTISYRSPANRINGAAPFGQSGSVHIHSFFVPLRGKLNSGGRP